MLDYVLIPKFCAETGYTDDAVRSKMSSGVWLEGQVWIKAPDGRIHISIRGYHAWLEGTLASALPQKRRSKSTSATAASAAASA